MKRVLMVAYHFPPLAGSSGIQRTLRFVQHLPSFGWQPLVLTCHPRAYQRISDDLRSTIPAGTIVRRAFAIDTAKHLSIAGRYLKAWARPDRWISWKPAAVREGLRMIEQFSPDVIWSTYPIATAHLIGAELAQRSGIPWVADFRDPMAQEGYPADPKTWQHFQAIESMAMQRATINLFTTQGAARRYRERYPEARDRIEILENGFDEECFAGIERHPQAREPLHPGSVTMLHSGIVYSSERDPTQLFQALAQLKASNTLRSGRFKFRFRASENLELLQRLTRMHGLEPFIEICPPIGYQAALQEMQRADALLVLQGSNCNEQVPAKVYEYLRAKRPILCLSSAGSDTEHVLRTAGATAFAALDAADQIVGILPGFLAAVRSGSATLPNPSELKRASRQERAMVLASMMDSICPGSSPAGSGLRSSP